MVRILKPIICFILMSLIVFSSSVNAASIQNFQDRSFDSGTTYWDVSDATVSGGYATTINSCSVSGYFEQDTTNIGVYFVTYISISWQGSAIFINDPVCGSTNIGKMQVTVYYTDGTTYNSAIFERGTTSYGTDTVYGSSLHIGKTVDKVRFTGINAKAAISSFIWNCC